MQGMNACERLAGGHAAVVHGWLVRASYMLCVGGLRLPKVLKNTTNMFSKYNILSQVPSDLR
jgi:hypothetical protein